jgi:hypothetical protein
MNEAWRDSECCKLSVKDVHNNVMERITKGIELDLKDRSEDVAQCKEIQCFGKRTVQGVVSHPTRGIQDS